MSGDHDATRVIHRYQLQAGDAMLRMPDDAVLLYVGQHQDWDHPGLFVWASVPIRAKARDRRIRVVSSGMPFDDAISMDHVGTVQMGNGQVFHVFDGGYYDEGAEG